MGVRSQNERVRDAEALRRCRLLYVPATDLLNGTPPLRHIGDKGYVGMGVIA